MLSPTLWKWGAVVVLCLALLGSCKLNLVQHDLVKAREAEVATLTLERDSARTRLVQVQARVQRANTDAANARLSLEKALEKEHDWAGGAVPSAVADSLCNTLRCTPAEPGAVRPSPSKP